VSIYVYVTRKADPLDESDGHDISAEEWRRVVSADHDLELRDPPDKASKDPTIYAAWDSYPGGYTAWFGLAFGNVEVKGIDEALLGKLRSFAAKLGGRIVSEEGEAFT
jgi:hypothetical protein